MLTTLLPNVFCLRLIILHILISKTQIGKGRIGRFGRVGKILDLDDDVELTTEKLLLHIKFRAFKW